MQQERYQVKKLDAQIEYILVLIETLNPAHVLHSTQL